MARFVVFSFLPNVGPVLNYRAVDDTWDAATLMIWTIVEPSTYLAASCFPTYRTFLQKALPKIRSIGNTRRTKKHSSPPTGVGAMFENSNKAFNTKTYPSVGSPQSPSLKEERSRLVACTREKTNNSDGSGEDLEAGSPDSPVPQNRGGIFVKTDMLLTRLD